ncbi:MAG TPA: tetratricopeptide repeat-containing serine protease family protein [Pyrinomonadaceae bacterium]|nr:tetratricopeptide repeat-containing serine protease family protein [Pyrinomonadaceae bacterium]
MLNRNLPRLLLFVLLLTTARTASASELNLPELVRRVKPSVVAIATFDQKGEALSTGSGFFIRPEQVVTNLHVLRGSYRAEIRTLEGKGRVYAVKGVLSIDDEGDLAILSVDIPAERSRPLELSTLLPEDGERIFVIGNPLRLEGSVSDGIVSAVREVPSLGKIIQVTAPVSHGNSGSPLFNTKGQVVGVITIRVINGENINLAIEASRINQLPPNKFMMLPELVAKNSQKDSAEAVAASLYRSGLDSMWLGNYDGALGYFENAVNKDPNRAEAWIQVGFCKTKQGKTADAIRAYQQALQLRPNSAEVYNKLGDAHFYAGRFSEAIDSYKQAVRLQPKAAEAYYNLVLTYREVGNIDMAEAQGKILQRLDGKLYERMMSEFRR